MRDRLPQGTRRYAWCLRISAGVILGVALTGATLAAKRPTPPPCEPARNLVRGDPLGAGSGAPAATVVEAGALAMTLPGVCETVTPKKFKGKSE